MVGVFPASSSIHLMPDSGVRSWWVTNDTKSDFSWLTWRSCVTSWSVSVSPMAAPTAARVAWPTQDRKSTRLNSSHSQISYAVFCLKKKKKTKQHIVEYNTEHL